MSAFIPLIYLGIAFIPLHGAPNLFFESKDWNDGKAEILHYQVLRPYRGDTLKEKAEWISERGFYLSDSGLFSRKSQGQEVLQSIMRRTGQAEGFSISAFSTVRFDRKFPKTRWWQTASLHGIYGAHWRKVTKEEGKIRLSTESSGLDIARSVEDLNASLITEEMLFTYLRNIPNQKGYVEEIWLLDSQLGDVTTSRVQYAKIEVVNEAILVKDLTTYQIQIIREDGKKMEFWLHIQGLHPIVKAHLVDGSEWTLQGWERKKYWSF